MITLAASGDDDDDDDGIDSVEDLKFRRSRLATPDTPVIEVDRSRKIWIVGVQDHRGWHDFICYQVSNRMTNLGAFTKTTEEMQCCLKNEGAVGERGEREPARE